MQTWVGLHAGMRRGLTGILFGAIFSSTVVCAQTYTFTNAGAVGIAGPSQSMVDTEYSGTNLEANVTSTAGIQHWTVPVTGTYGIEARGAQGFGDFGGRGAVAYGEVVLTAGTMLKIVVGQKGAEYKNYPATTYNHQFGGGGGSFITRDDNTPLVIAGGGGGSHMAEFLATVDAQTTTAGAAGIGSISGAGGIDGGGGAQATSADGGGGLLTNGAGIAGGAAFVNGATGGIDEGVGGFGGGGGTSSWNNYRGGGGGGYSGGGGGNNASACCAAGGGGGSYAIGENMVLFAGTQLGDGLVKITFGGDKPVDPNQKESCHYYLVPASASGSKPYWFCL